MSMNNVPEEILSRLRTRQLPIALVGASKDPEKYGNIIIRNLRSKGYKVVPVNPKEETIDGLPVVASVAQLPKELAFVNFVVPPKVTLSVLPMAVQAGVEAVWFQDGSFDQAVLDYASAHFKYVVHDACVMVVTNFV